MSGGDQGANYKNQRSVYFKSLVQSSWRFTNILWKRWLALNAKPNVSVSPPAYKAPYWIFKMAAIENLSLSISSSSSCEGLGSLGAS